MRIGAILSRTAQHPALRTQNLLRRRLYRDGDESPYGIHSYYKVDQWMEDEKRYKSMGCIVVTEQILDVIEKTFELSKNKMTVITTDDVDKTLENLMAKASWMGS